ncbi:MULTISPECIES: murein hydrolase activator EnvC family protein [Bacillus]|uniref:Peptidase M23 n=2 Tax=Bacillus TaxID=1386 RepID=A0A0M3RA27_9BACI|nr:MULTISPECIES: peptidoglycan DD-metalloendopeptidase family protein [Bacillus]ALC82446.1 peptidase M23 [Bacillus gobiensis]MBP1081330.1 peptidoglycan hydrolase CwlO-like protein [Bacillus capparidis]MED1096008.1 peptidoglycan DD-metalloendopeptidase family protein [Bacillus capparidis]
MKGKVLSIGVATAVCASGFILPALENRAYAYEDLDKQREEVENKQSELEKRQADNEIKRAELEAQEKDLNADLQKLDTEIITTNDSIEKRQADIKQTNQEINKLKKEIKEITKRIEKRNKLLQDRARAIQENGGNVNYLDVLLGAQTFGDFVSRVSAVTTIVSADKDIIEAHKKDLKLVEQKEAELNNKLDKQHAALDELEALKADLDKRQTEKNKLIEQVKKDQKKAVDELGSMENEADLLKRQDEAIKAEETHRKQQEAEKRRKAEETQNQQTASASEPVESNTSGFIKPAPGSFTSPFGPRDGGNHFGVDIALAGSDVPVHAAASGTVYNAHYSTSYGNVIFVTHNINGQTYQTVYAHLSGMQVSTGDRVEQGQRIGTMGNTGASHGQHLHFELHKGLWNAAKSNAVDPRPYIQ